MLFETTLGLGRRIGTLPLKALEKVPLMEVLDRIYAVAPGMGKLLTQSWYRYMTRLDQRAEMVFMNYGYAEPNSGSEPLVLSQADEVNRYCIQLYHHVAGAVDLTDRDVLEVGCGRGGGAAYVARYLRPRSMTGVDIAEQAIDFCRDFHRVDGLSFLQADAEDLPFADGTFDAVVNIESSHCYPSMVGFLSEVRRILKPDGHLLFADRREHKAMPLLRQQLSESGFEVLREQIITSHVLHALDLDQERRMRLIRQRVPIFVRKLFKQFAATKGTSLYEAFQSGRWGYCSYVLRRLPAA